MFDIGLMEILLVLIIALLVIGPERMPELARKIGQFIGKTKRFINTMKEDSELSNTVREIQASINLEEERKQIQDISQSLSNDLSSASQDIDMSEFKRPFGNQVAELTSSSQFNKAPSQPAAPKPIEPETPANEPPPISQEKPQAVAAEPTAQAPVEPPKVAQPTQEIPAVKS